MTVCAFSGSVRPCHPFRLQRKRLLTEHKIVVPASFAASAARTAARLLTTAAAARESESLACCAGRAGRAGAYGQIKRRRQGHES